MAATVSGSRPPSGDIRRRIGDRPGHRPGNGPCRVARTPRRRRRKSLRIADTPRWRISSRGSSMPTPSSTPPRNRDPIGCTRPFSSHSLHQDMHPHIAHTPGHYEHKRRCMIEIQDGSSPSPEYSTRNKMPRHTQLVTSSMRANRAPLRRQFSATKLHGRKSFDNDRIGELAVGTRFAP